MKLQQAALDEETQNDLRLSRKALIVSLPHLAGLGRELRDDRFKGRSGEQEI